ncbi:Hypothetical protein KVN_LOCUS105 [uncultured virus]|nr:Hypothetical protein KVN_LOCUS105 [uncultured virus]
MSEYLNYENIKKLNDSNNQIEINCYFNGLYWICPNPLDNSRNNAFNNYKISEIIRISEKDFNNQENWNS